MEWLSHSQKKHCELCKTPFRFHQLYHPDMPKALLLLRIHTATFTKYLFPEHRRMARSRAGGERLVRASLPDALCLVLLFWIRLTRACWERLLFGKARWDGRP